VIGRTVGKYKILDQIGEGGMGVVYRAEHVVLGSPAAVKVLLAKYTLDAGVVDRFFHEAKAASGIRHVGIVEVFDYGRLANNQAYIAMELLRGESLAEFIARNGGRVAYQVGAQIAMQMLAALDAAHVVGVIHRDIKPDNVMLVPDSSAPGGIRVKILDFGIAKLLGERGSRRAKTHGGAILGTPAYMAPEQCKGGGTVDARADLYATGCILFEMLAGRPPFVAEGEGEVIAMHIYEPPPRLTALSRGAPVELDALLAKMLQKSPDDRVPSAAWALAALERVTLPPLGRVEIIVPAASPGSAGARSNADALRSEIDRGQFAVSLPKSPREGLPKWVPIAVLVVALVIAVVAIFVIGGSGHPLAPK